jgi:hypothetical protein
MPPTLREEDRARRAGASAGVESPTVPRSGGVDVARLGRAGTSYGAPLVHSDVAALHEPLQQRTKSLNGGRVHEKPGARSTGKAGDSRRSRTAADVDTGAAPLRVASGRLRSCSRNAADQGAAVLGRLATGSDENAELHRRTRRRLASGRRDGCGRCAVAVRDPPRTRNADLGRSRSAVSSGSSAEDFRTRVTAR